MDKILVTGSLGQIGSELVLKLREKHGKDNVIASDVRDLKDQSFAPFEKLDVLDYNNIENIVKKYQITKIYHLAAILSANGENNPQLCWKINMDGLVNILEIARIHKLKQIITPSSIAAFGPETPKDNVPQETILLPKTIYGVTKVAGELLCDYYVKKFGMDIRGIRYPGLISSKTLPGGGTTDYAVDIFYKAVAGEKYNCFLKEDTILPMMYMDDAIRGTIELAEADFKDLSYYSNYNFAAVSFSCQEVAKEIKKHYPDFEIEYKPDFRQQIADSWPRSIDDAIAKKDWGWKAEFDLAKITKTMINDLS
ncbi:NAD-dependent epimerase/dehydratase family protein [Rickettsiales bacterium]|nr:NAD-dependent epimerase/dehydratase family protein [Rickettsiales bacterium]MDB2550708.1 NAD-dependent epimerase/dehydratase family protein [Rickettsiales bacterium]